MHTLHIVICVFSIFKSVCVLCFNSPLQVLVLDNYAYTTNQLLEMIRWGHVTLINHVTVLALPRVCMCVCVCACVCGVSRFFPTLKELSLASCPLITDKSVMQLLRRK